MYGDGDEDVRIVVVGLRGDGAFIRLVAVTGEVQFQYPAAVAIGFWKVLSSSERGRSLVIGTLPGFQLHAHT